ncbi:MAG: protelomerase family protein [Leptolyngbyaceae cyanobacterium]
MTSRQSIIKTYRQRIKAGKRSKLSKQERAELIEWFIIDLKGCESELQCQQRCHAELQLLEEGYPVKSIAAQYLPQWRKAIEQAVADGNLPTMELPPTEHGIVYPHWALVHLRYDNQIYQAINEDVAKANNKRQDNLQPVHPHRFIQTAVKLLDSDDFRDVAAGLLALTGRRFSEIISKGTFEPTTHPYILQFTGQLKKKLEAETYTIATLSPAEEIIQSIATFRSHKRIKELAMLDPAAINSRINSSVRERIQRAFQATGTVPILDGEESVSAHNLRGVYAAVAIYLWCPPNQATHRFIQAHLGHVIGESELERRKNSRATQHYFHYYIVDNHHQALNQKGYMLQHYPLPPLTDAMPIPASREHDSVHNQQPDAATQTFTPEPNPTSTTETKAIAPSTPLETQPMTMPNPASTTPDPAPKPTHEAAMAQRHSDWSIAPLAQTIQWLQAKLDEAHTEIRELRAQSSQPDAGEIQKLREENQRLQNENEQLRTELEPFNRLKQIMGIPSEDLNGQSPEFSPEAEPTENFRGQQPIPVANDGHSQGAIASEMPLANAPHSPAFAIATHSEPSPVEQALEKVIPQDYPNTAENRAISAMINHNNQPGLSHEAKWYISIPVLSDLIRSAGATTSQKPLRVALDARQAEITQHHQRHQLGVRHNVKHGKAERMVGDLISLV